MECFPQEKIKASKDIFAPVKNRSVAWDSFCVCDTKPGNNILGKERKKLPDTHPHLDSTADDDECALQGYEIGEKNTYMCNARYPFLNRLQKGERDSHKKK